MPTRERVCLPVGSFELLTQGPREAPLALCLHGFPDHPPSFEPLLSALGASGYRAVAPWLRGYAPSTVEGPYDVDRLVEDAAALAEALSPGRRVYLIGHDWGAVIAYAMAARLPERLAAVVTMAVPHPGAFFAGIPRHPAQLRRSFYMFFFQLPFLAEIGVCHDDFALIDRLWRDWSPSLTPDPDAMRALKGCLAKSMPAPIAYYRAALRPSPREIRRTAAAARERIRVPLLSLAGGDDGCIAPEIGEGEARFFDGPYRREVLPGVGHFMVNEAPEAVAERVLAWFAAHRA
jgi:pimeloyl-ACP methyl ester carboxylesterase